MREAIELIEHRFSADRFDPRSTVTDDEVEKLVRLATRAPSAFNLQNWRFVAVRTRAGKEILRQAAYGQSKVADAAVTFIVCGQLPDHEVLAERLRPSVEAGFMPSATALEWERAVRERYSHDPIAARDEAIRSAALAGATLMHAAAALGLASGPMVGFDPGAVCRAFGLRPDEVPVMLVAVGVAAPGNWPQKPRLPVSEVLELS